MPLIVRGTKRKGEALTDPNDKRTRSEKQRQLKRERKQSWFSGFWKTEARKVCEERLKHYESTGNVHKADIYRRKLER